MEEKKNLWQIFNFLYLFPHFEFRESKIIYCLTQQTRACQKYAVHKTIDTIEKQYANTIKIDQ